MSCLSTLDDGPVATFNFDTESGRYTSLNGNDLALSGKSFVPSLLPIGLALSLNGLTTKGIKLAPSLPALSTDLTVVCWVRIALATPFLPIIGLFSGDAIGSSFGLDPVSGSTMAYDADRPRLFGNVVASGDALPLGAWLHLALAASSASFYLNGAPNGTRLVGPVSLAPDRSLVLGFSPTHQAFLQADVAEVTSYRSKLSSADILDLYLPRRGPRRLRALSGLFIGKPPAGSDAVNLIGVISQVTVSTATHTGAALDLMRCVSQSRFKVTVRVDAADDGAVEVRVRKAGTYCVEAKGQASLEPTSVFFNVADTWYSDNSGGYVVVVTNCTGSPLSKSQLPVLAYAFESNLRDGSVNADHLALQRGVVTFVPSQTAALGYALNLDGLLLPAPSVPSDELSVLAWVRFHTAHNHASITQLRHRRLVVAQLRQHARVLHALGHRGLVLVLTSAWAQV